jgi:23S rRNA pseudouridine1911/1915/1917 synthase
VGQQIVKSTNVSWCDSIQARAPVEKLFEVVYEDSELLVINKPAGLVCHPTKTDEYSSLISRVRLYLGAGGEPQLVNRLDRETSGITIIAKGQEVARRLRRLWENRQVRKEYLAIVHGQVGEAHQVIAARLGKDELSAVVIKDCVREDGAEAKTEFWLQSTFERLVPLSGAASVLRQFSLLKVVPHTGRKHQIRIHLAHREHPIVGDKLYGGNEDLYLALVENRLTPEQWSQLILPYHALHAAEVGFDWGEQERVFRAQPEPWFKAFCSPAALPD